MKTKFKPTTIDDLLEKLSADPEFVRNEQAREAERKKLEDELSRAEAPVVSALKEVGVSVKSVWDLVNTSDPYPRALPVLLEHLQRPYPVRVRQGIARAMAVPASKFAWETLLRLYKNDFDRKTNGVKWAIGCALAAAVDEELIPDLIALVNDTRHGRNRVVLIEPLARSRNKNAHLALEQGRDDPDIAAEIRRVLARKRKSGRHH